MIDLSAGSLRTAGLRWGAHLALFLGSTAYFGFDLSAREVTLLESQDLGIAHALFKTFALSPDHSPLHFVFLRLWESLNASSVAFLRAPSVVFAALAVLVVSRMAEELAGRAARWLAAALFATNPYVVDAARSMRLYALAILLATLCLWTSRNYLRTRDRRSFVSFAAVAVLAVYNHLFAWLLVGPLALWIGVDIVRGEKRRAELRWLGTRGAIAAILLLPQLVHVFIAIGYTSERHSLYGGLPSGPASFLVPIGRILFLGEGEVPIASVAVLIPFALVVLGMPKLWRSAPELLAVLPPALFVSWALSFSNPVEPRYLNFLTPLIALAMAIGATRRFGPVPPAATMTVGAAVFALSLYATHAAYGGPRTDWYEGAARLAAMREAGDVVAVFPDFWESTFRRYGAFGDVAAVAFPVDLDRVLARRKRVLLVSYPGREFGSIEALLRARTTYKPIFHTQLREQWTVYAVTPAPDPQPRDSASVPSLLFAGLLGSGGYPWQGARSAAPLARLESLFRKSTGVIVGYEAYHPPWYVRPLLGGELSELLEPNAEVDRGLTDAGVSAVARVCPSGSPSGPDRLEKDGLSVIPAMDAEDAASRRPRRYELGGISVGVVSVCGGTIDDEGLRRAKASLGPTGRLVTIVPASPDYGRVATSGEKSRARRLVDLGADVVVGIGGYAAKEVETYRGGVIAYSLGTLLRPPTLSLTTLDSSGIGLRVSFPTSARASFDVLPLTFDDQIRAAPGASNTTSRLVRDADGGEHGDVLADRLAQAHAGYVDSNGAVGDLGAWREGPQALGSPLEQWYLRTFSGLTAWFPVTPRTTPLRPLDGAFLGGGTYVARRGALALGEYRRVVELDPGTHASVWVRFDALPSADLLEITYGLADDRLRSKTKALYDQRIHVSIGPREVFTQSVSWRVGWTGVLVDVRSVAPGPITLKVDANGTHFPIAVDARWRRP